MPSYRGIVTMSLSTANLQASTTKTPHSRLGPAVTACLAAIASELQEGVEKSTLAEIPIRTRDEFQTRLQFLGEHHDMPFFMVRVDKDNLVSLSTRSEVGKSLSAGVSPQVQGETSFSGPSQLSASAFGHRRVPVEQVHHDTSDKKSKKWSYASDRGSSSELSEPLSEDSQGGISGKRQINKNDGKAISVPKPTDSWIVLNAKVTKGKDIKPPVISSEQHEPQALCLTVTLSRDAFMPQPNSNCTRPLNLDLKMDIYLNGELCTSSYISERWRNDAKMTNVMGVKPRFAGRRVGRLIEAPWIMVPSDQRVDGSKREPNASFPSLEDINKRWDDINQLLGAEAEKGGRNKWGELGCLGEYLESLSKLDLPEEAHTLQRPGGQKFAVLDVVITFGHGKKEDPSAGYLSNPTAMRTHKLEANAKFLTASKDPGADTPGSATPKPLDRIILTPRAKGRQTPAPSPATPPTERSRRSTGREKYDTPQAPPNTPKPRSGPKVVPQKTFKGHTDSSANPNPTRRGNSNFMYAIPKKTAQEELDEIEQAAQILDEVETNGGFTTYATRNKAARARSAATNLGWTNASPPLASPPPPATPKNSPVLKNGPNRSKLEQSTAKKEELASSARPTRSAAPTMNPPHTPVPQARSRRRVDAKSGVAPALQTTPGQPATPKPAAASPMALASATIAGQAQNSVRGSPVQQTPASTASTLRTPNTATTTAENDSPAMQFQQDTPWPTPALSDDCVITYKPGMMRQVRGERTGWFKESGVFVGVRYLVGSGGKDLERVSGREGSRGYVQGRAQSGVGGHDGVGGISSAVRDLQMDLDEEGRGNEITMDQNRDRSQSLGSRAMSISTDDDDL